MIGWRQWQALRANPVYLREKGHWGTPNPFYANLTRYSPFMVIGAVLFGVCAGSANPSLFSGNDDLVVAACFLCLPGFLLTAVAVYGQFMALALTAPSISLERAAGTWDILRMTPVSMQTILLGKLFGALSRLRIWPLLLALSLLQGGILAASVTIFGGDGAFWGWLLGLAAMLRPWTEVIFAAFVGLYVSTVVESAMMALVGAYTAVVLLKLFNSSGFWLAAVLLANGGGATSLVLPTVGPVLVYGLAITAVLLGLMQQAKKLSYG
ncbi:MAG: hypothetical protein KC441_06535 [Anaerolineales bacterium]|nr:hypothetical protein [Anaerolineales bacterium]